jgi:hypothetical protein
MISGEPPLVTDPGAGDKEKTCRRNRRIGVLFVSRRRRVQGVRRVQGFKRFPHRSITMKKNHVLFWCSSCSFPPNLLPTHRASVTVAVGD